jgi:hypothetical protein
MKETIVKNKGSADQIRTFTSFDEFLLFVNEQGGEVIVKNFNMNMIPTVTINKQLTYADLREIVHGKSR